MLYLAYEELTRYHFKCHDFIIMLYLAYEELTQDQHSQYTVCRLIVLYLAYEELTLLFLSIP